MLEARALSVAYGGSLVVRDVSLALEPGRITGLAGASGSGKTTLALTLAGYAIPGALRQGGAVLLDGRELGNLSAAELRALWGPGSPTCPRTPRARSTPRCASAGRSARR